MTEAAVAGHSRRLSAALEQQVQQVVRRALDEDWVGRLWARDASLWSADEHVAGLIAERLGWLDLPTTFDDRIEELEAFARGVRDEGFSAALVCGMGGSSLAPDVLAAALPRGELGMPLRILDSTDPAQVRAATAASDPARTLYLIASKSGTTTETLAFLAHFWQVEDDIHADIPQGLAGQHFVAVTDPPPSLAAIPHSDLFREVFLNPADVGGRYSALSYVGLVPAALLGLDLRALLGAAALMAEDTRSPSPENPGLWLGATLGALAAAGRDKLTLVIEPRSARLGAWIEQLVAESTGKRGVGVVPVDGESLGDPTVYGDDRVFVRISSGADSAWQSATGASLDALAAAGQPVIDLSLGSDGPLTLFGDAPLRLTAGHDGMANELRRHLARVRPRGFISIGAYLAPRPERDAMLRSIAQLVRDRTRRPVTVGYGPRFLHSTGQLHKGGAGIGCFLQLTAAHPEDLPIPGWHESFGTLIDAQAAGDFAALEAHDLPVARMDLSAYPDAGLSALHAALAEALEA